MIPLSVRLAWKIGLGFEVSFVIGVAICFFFRRWLMAVDFRRFLLRFLS